MNLRLTTLVTVSLASCAPYGAVTGKGAPEIAKEIRYVSSDLARVLVFSKQGARLGDTMAIYQGSEPSDKIVKFNTNDNVECISIGSSGNTVEYAIKRPLKPGDRYRCLKTTFLVARCFQYCNAAVIKIEAPFGGISPTAGRLTSYMYVDECVGVLVFSQDKDLANGIPLDAAWLRGTVGILASKNYPECYEKPDYSDGQGD